MYRVKYELVVDGILPRILPREALQLRLARSDEQRNGLACAKTGVSRRVCWSMLFAGLNLLRAKRGCNLLLPFRGNLSFTMLAPACRMTSADKKRTCPYVNIPQKHSCNSSKPDMLPALAHLCSLPGTREIASHDVAVHHVVAHSEDLRKSYLRLADLTSRDN